jgi:WD40 repeat protein
MPQRLRIFVSSPGDVPDERLRADLIVDKLAQDYGRYFSIESYRWEHEPLLASGHFQDAIEPPSASDIVILILWSRLGTPLPQKTATREYRGLDGRSPVTGTEWEFEDALAAARAHGAPDILVFRNVSPAAVDSRDPNERARSLAQLDALDDFWKRHFSDRGVFLAASVEYRDIAEFAAALEESLRKLIERRVKSVIGQATGENGPTWLGNPFRGLQAYEFEHAAIFFGRDALIARAAEQIAAQGRADSAFLLVVGASGSGKSSLVKAALVPRLMKPQRIEGRAFLRRLVFRPSDAPQDLILGLVQALTRAPASVGIGLGELLGPGQSPKDLAAHLRAAIGSPGFIFANALARVTDAARSARLVLPHEQANLIVVIDQFEELFTVGAIGAEERRTFIRLLAGLARSGIVWVIATMRADFWHHILDEPELMRLTERSGRVDVASPSLAEVAEMIRKPAQAAGLQFQVHSETGLGLDAVLAEHAASEQGVLPLLSFTLDTLYAEDVIRRGLRELTFESYDELGGLEGAIATRAEEVAHGLPPAVRNALPGVLRALVTVSDAREGSPLARSVALDSFAPGSDARTLVDAMIAARLLVASREGDDAVVRVAHEALIGRWDRAREQLATDRRDLETRELIERQCVRWRDAEGRARRQLLLRDPDLASALDLQRRWGAELDPLLGDFIGRSHQRSHRLQQLAVAAMVVFGLVALAASGFGVMAYLASERAAEAEKLASAQRDEAVRQRNAALRGLEAQSRYLAGAADDEVKDGNFRGAIALLRVALPDPANNNDRPLVRQALASAYRALYANRERGRLDMPADATAVTTDGVAQTIVIGTADRLIVRHGLSSADQQVLPHQFGVPARLVLAPGGERLAMTGADGAIAVRDLHTNREILRHAGEGAGTRTYFLHSADRLLVASADRTVWHLLDIATGRELGIRRITVSKATMVTSLVDARHDIVAVVADGQVRRLSSDDLSDAATLDAGPAQEFALGASFDGKTIYVAAAKDVLEGGILVLDRDTLALQRAFGKLTGGARHIAVSPDGQVIAVHSLIGIDLLDGSSGERLHQIAAGRDAVHGRFISRSEYMVYGPNGYVRRYSVDLGSELGAYRTIDTGAIDEIDVLPDRSGFLTISDRPSVTNWAFEPRGTTREYTVPLVVQGRDLGIPLAIEASSVALGRSEVLASYIDHSARSWNLETGEMRLVRKADPKAEPSEQVALLSNGAVVLAEKSGRLKIYTPAQGADRPAAEVVGEPLSYLGELEVARAFMVSQSGAATIIDLATPESPKLEPVPALGTCARQASIFGVALCIDGDGVIRALRASDGRVVSLPAKPSAKPTAAYVSPDGGLIAATWSNGDLEVRSAADTSTLVKQTLTMQLGGNMLKAAAQSPLLSEEDREKIRRGATELEVRAGANSLSISPDRARLAVAMPDRTLRIIDLRTGESRQLTRPQPLLVMEIAFSPNGQLLGAVERGDYQVLYIYDLTTGERLAGDSLASQVSPKLARLENGHGFATIDKTGRIIVHPMFQKLEDLMVYLKEQFPDELTPMQRRAFFLE